MESAEELDSVTVALLEPVSQDYALSPANDSERLLQRATFDTPIRLDCQLRAWPGLAVAWSRDSAGRVWTLTLAEEARSPDGSPVTAHHLVALWDRRKERLEGLESAVALDEKRISVTLSRPQDSVPRILADPAFSLTIEPAEGPFRLGFEMLPDSDPRDALDGGADLTITRDPALVEYISPRPEFETFPLPWSRTYILLQPAGAEPIDGVIGPDSTPGSLVRDAVRADARPAEPSFWWDSLASCARGPVSAGFRPQASRIVYAGGDEVGRGLAERIVALAKVTTPLRAAALQRTEFAAALREGSERAYIVALPRQTLAPCRDSAEWPRDASLLPLIDTRAHAIVRKGGAPLAVEWDGTVRVLDSGAGGRQ
ncbi:MAG: hypothetical protein ACREMZ_06430 [Gemmatimonadales bacterium]